MIKGVQYSCLQGREKYFPRSCFWGNDNFSINNALNNTSIQFFVLKLFKHLTLYFYMKIC